VRRPRDSRIGQYASALLRLSQALRRGEGELLEPIVEAVEQVKRDVPPELEPLVFSLVLTGSRRCGHGAEELVLYSRADRPGQRRVACRGCINARWRRKMLRRRGRPLTRREVALRANAARWARAS
jgi:hypothetical protein